MSRQILEAVVGNSEQIRNSGNVPEDFGNSSRIVRNLTIRELNPLQRPIVIMINALFILCASLRSE